MSCKARLAAVGIALAATAPLVHTAAYGDVSDLTAAELTNSVDQIAAASVPTDPDLTCDVRAGGRDLVQRTNYGVGEIEGMEFAEAIGQCASFNSSRVYQVSLSLKIEYFVATSLTTGYWTPVPAPSTTFVSQSGSGVTIVRASLTSSYPGTSPYLNVYHRAHAILRPLVPGASARHAYSPTWFMAR